MKKSKIYTIGEIGQELYMPTISKPKNKIEFVICKYCGSDKQLHKQCNACGAH